ncbi:hypothetical protein F0L17_03595 [Streptomyces sp. TRM43335]|uniref:Cellulose synthase n=1 Tax=Streptomyces taklimakanensis TaxID=2569853 RepID=A0A6G2B7I7_9ACTN|nr:hypothetical protein [Streptomyces taklimakanensis]MTE18228.1 hypothetical protein [Streptomyces taklimakanensis]
MLTTTVCAALSAAGLAVALLTAYRRRFVVATRVAAFALVPIGLAMSGLVALFGKVGSAVASWASGLVLDPMVWAGFGVLAVAVVLYVAAGFAARRSRGRGSAEGSGKRRAVEPGASGAALEGERGPARKGTGEDDFSDIEAILRKHGI